MSEEFVNDPMNTARRSLMFLTAGFLFLLGALLGFAAAGYRLYSSGFPYFGDGMTTERALTIAFLQNISPIVLIGCAFACSLIGTRLLRAGGVATPTSISRQDMAILGPLIAAGNADAITQWIRVNSLTGAVGFFTKIGLTGLPLATIALTIFLALAGIFNPAFQELAKLTLGAFLGSFVQRQVEVARTQTPPNPRVPESGTGEAL